MCENVLVVTVDSLRVDAVADAAAEQGVSFVPDLADAGVSFDRAFATGPGTSPSFPALLCGTLPLSHEGLGPLSADRPRVAELLSGSGLATGGFHCNPFLSRFFEYDRGFDAFEDYQNPLMGVATSVFPRGIELGDGPLARVDEAFDVTGRLRRAYSLVSGRPRPYVGADVLTDDTIDWLEEVDEPFFCWTHYMDVHHPCHPPEEYRQRYGVADVSHEQVADWYSELVGGGDPGSHPRVEAMGDLYCAAIEYVSEQIDRLISVLRRRDLYEDTLVIVTSDHGELHGERGTFGKPARMFDELLRVPLVVANGPDYLADARTDLVSLLDLPSVYHDALGLPVPDAYEGRLPGVDPPREHVVAEHEVGGDVVVAARSADWLFEADERSGERRLFRTRDGELRAAGGSDTPEARRLRGVVRERLSDLDVEGTHLRSDVEGDVESRLEDLGYL